MNIFLGVLDLFLFLGALSTYAKKIPEMNGLELIILFALEIAFLGSGLMLLL